MDSKMKYLKYKFKYLTLKKNIKQKGGGVLFNDYKVIQYCCQYPTQFMDRLCNESAQHAVASSATSWYNYTASMVGTLASDLVGKSSTDITKTLATRGNILDGIVNIFHPTNEKMLSIPPTLQLLNAGSSIPISDHIGLNLIVRYEKLKFNIISYNLEGLCPKDRHRERIANLTKQIKPLIDINTIMVCQELVLKEYAKDVHTKRRHADIIKMILGDKFIGNIDYTSCIFYRQDMWDVEKLEIRRKTCKAKEEEKFSNAFKFIHKISGDCFIVVNIHLLAPTPGRQLEGLAVSTMSTVGIPSCSMSTLEDKQNYELTNIIRKTISHFNTNETNPKIPIYLCGDFNRDTSDKQTWVRGIIKKLQSEPDEELKQDEEEFEELELEHEEDEFEELMLPN